MEKVSISLFRKTKTHRLVGLSIYKDEGDEELRKVIGLIEDSLHKNFPSAETTRQKAVRELFGERR